MPCARELKGRLLWIIVVDGQRSANALVNALVNVVKNAYGRAARSSLGAGIHAGNLRCGCWQLRRCVPAGLQSSASCRRPRRVRRVRVGLMELVDAATYDGHRHVAGRLLRQRQ